MTQDKMRGLSPHTNQRPLRVLVVIASFGEKNLGFLRQIIRTYRDMTFHTDVVVVSEAPKDLGPEVQVKVGLPARNPWTLPFAHKAIFAERADQYDLFAYSEDDIWVTEANIQAFLKATTQLDPDEIAGFLHYEKDRAGNTWMVGVHRHFHWKPDSVRQRGSYTVAEFTNQHSAFYLLTRSQLQRAIASGGFLREPHEGLYDLLCTAATDPYTSCGLRKVICISELESFLIHHLPNKYVAELDVPLESFREQIQTLMSIRDGFHPNCSLIEIEARLQHFWGQKSYYEQPQPELLQLVPREARSILSVGCGWGETEEKLQRRGAKVTALPMDSVIGAVAAGRGIEVMYAPWQESIARLEGRRFDCVLLTDLLHLHAHPGQFAAQAARLVRTGGVLVLGGPNFDRLPWRVQRALRIGEFGKLRRFELCGVSVCGPRGLRQPLHAAGMRLTKTRWLNHPRKLRWFGGRQVCFGRWTARGWILQARRECEQASARALDDGLAAGNSPTPGGASQEHCAYELGRQNTGG